MNVGTKLFLASIAIALILLAAWLVRVPSDGTRPKLERESATVEHVGTTLLEGATTSPTVEARTVITGAQSRLDVASAPSETRASDGVAHVRVLVLDRRAGTPIADAYVVAQFSDDVDASRVSTPPIPNASIERHVTDSNGRVEIVVPAGRDMEIRAGLDLDWIGSKFTTVRALSRGDSRDVTLRIPSDRDLEFACRFVDDATRAPIAGVRVALANSEESSAPIATSDERGFVHLVAEDWRKVAYRATCAGHGVVYFCPEPEHTSLDEALIVPLAASASLQVRIVDAEQTPVVGAVVEVDANGLDCAWNGIQSAALGALSYPQWTEITDDDGRVTFRELPARIALDVSMNEEHSIEHLGADAARPSSLFLAPGEQRAFEWIARGTHDVNGRVLDAAGAPIAGCEVWLMKRPQPDLAQFLSFMQPEFTAKSDRDGRFEFKHVHTGEWSIGPAAQDWRESSPTETFVPNAQHVDVTESSAATFVEIRVQRGLTIRGKVLASNGAPARDAMAMVSTLDHVLLAYAHTEDDGSFALGGLSAGTFEVSAAADAGRDGGSEELHVAAGAENVVLHLQKGASMSGRVVDANGRGAVARLTFRRIDADASHAERFDFERMATDAEGDFRIAQLDPGTYDIAAYHPDGRAGVLRHVQLSAEREADDLVVRLERGGRVRIRAAHATGVATFKLFANGVLIDAWDAEKGESKTSSVPACRIRVSVELDGGRGKYERGIDVAVGETFEVSIGDEAR